MVAYNPDELYMNDDFHLPKLHSLIREFKEVDRVTEFTVDVTPTLCFMFGNAYSDVQIYL